MNIICYLYSKLFKVTHVIIAILSVNVLFNSVGRLSVSEIFLSAALASEEVSNDRKYSTMTNNSDFLKSCIAYVDGYASQGNNEELKQIFKRKFGHCERSDANILALGVTHENERNNHQGSKNFDPKIQSYMADFDPTQDFDKFLTVDLQDVDGGSTLKIGINTIDFDKINVTGWPLHFGHIFVGISDPSVSGTINSDIIISFEAKVRDTVKPSQSRNNLMYSGRRILLGALLRWVEAEGRTNKSHFLEFNIDQSSNYNLSYKEKVGEFCKDRVYDRCFYDKSGHYAEGRFVSLSSADENLSGNMGDGNWHSISINLSSVARSLLWASSPASWSDAHVSALYFGVEATGHINTVLEIRKYTVLSKSGVR